MPPKVLQRRKRANPIAWLFRNRTASRACFSRTPSASLTSTLKPDDGQAARALPFVERSQCAPIVGCIVVLASLAGRGLPPFREIPCAVNERQDLDLRIEYFVNKPVALYQKFPNIRLLQLWNNTTTLTEPSTVIPHYRVHFPITAVRPSRNPARHNRRPRLAWNTLVSSRLLSCVDEPFPPQRFGDFLV